MIDDELGVLGVDEPKNRRVVENRRDGRRRVDVYFQINRFSRMSI